jgi:EAL domain-containing protein (putative c-di-GMP-specific phosphodiesterase class I)
VTVRRAFVVLLAAYWAALASGVSSALVTHVAYLALMAAPTAAVAARAITVRQERPAWGVLAIGLVLWTAGSVWQVTGDLLGAAPALLSVADALWLASYPFFLFTLGRLARPWLSRATATLALDIVLVGLATAALVTAAVLPWVMANVSGSSRLVQVTTLAYPLADCLVLSTALIGAVVGGRRAGARWGLIALGAVGLLAADSLWTLQIAAGTWAPIMSSNALYPLWPALAAAAAWLPAPERAPAGGRASLRTHVAALGAAATSILLLVINEWLAVPAASVLLAGLGLMIAVHRTWRAVAGSLRASLAATRERETVEDVRHALAHEELELHYQPLVDACSGTVKGAEALLRWRRDGRLVPPDSSLGAVENSDLITPLTDFVLDRALAEAARWRRAGHALGVSVNLATANLSEPDLPARVSLALERHGLPAEALTLEITETAAVDDNAVADHVLHALDALGVSLAVDDFGTGHSSLVRLARFPIRELKIDRSFVQEMSTATRPIVAISIQLARTLGLRVVAEGVEDAATLDALRDLGCDLAQGYHVSRPLPAADFAAWLRTPVFV